jgi:hypothetical protein
LLCYHLSNPTTLFLLFLPADDKEGQKGSQQQGDANAGYNQYKHHNLILTGEGKFA